MKELNTVVLERACPEHGLKKGDVGVIVHTYEGGKGFEVEFVTGNGRTVALVTLKAGDLRPVAGEEIFHVRDLAA